MKLSIGTDIVEISRIKDLIDKKGDIFISYIYTDNEIKYCEERKVQKYQSYAARFAAKEAIYKAINDRLVDSKYSWKDFEVLNDESGRPIVNLKLKVKDLDSIDISLSHCKEYAVAYVTAVYKEN